MNTGSSSSARVYVEAIIDEHDAVRCTCNNKLGNLSEVGLEIKCDRCHSIVRIDVQIYKLRLYDRILTANANLAAQIAAV